MFRLSTFKFRCRSPKAQVRRCWRRKCKCNRTEIGNVIKILVQIASASEVKWPRWMNTVMTTCSCRVDNCAKSSCQWPEYAVYD